MSAEDRVQGLMASLAESVDRAKVARRRADEASWTAHRFCPQGDGNEHLCLCGLPKEHPAHAGSEGSDG